MSNISRQVVSGSFLWIFNLFVFVLSPGSAIIKVLAELEVAMNAMRCSPESEELARSRLWGGPKLGAELDGLSRRPELPLSDP